MLSVGGVSTQLLWHSEYGQVVSVRRHHSPNAVYLLSTCVYSVPLLTHCTFKCCCCHRSTSLLAVFLSVHVCCCFFCVSSNLQCAHSTYVFGVAKSNFGTFQSIFSKQMFLVFFSYVCFQTLDFFDSTFYSTHGWIVDAAQSPRNISSDEIVRSERDRTKTFYIHIYVGLFTVLPISFLLHNKTIWYVNGF